MAETLLPVSFYKGNLAAIKSSQNRTDGQFYFASDAQEVLIQDGENLVKISDFVILAAETDRIAILSPLPKLYLVNETGELWYYSSYGGWILLNEKGESGTSAPSRNIVFGTMNVAAACHLIAENGSTTNWTALMTMLTLPENFNISTNTYLRTYISQASSGSMILAIYQWNTSANQLMLIGNTDILPVSQTGFIGSYLTNILSGNMDASGIYYFAILHNMNGVGIIGSATTQNTNNLPYISGTIGNLGNLSVSPVPSQISFSSEVLNRRYGDIFSSALPPSQAISTLYSLYNSETINSLYNSETINSL